jgi:catechol 2,3-dioxygenase-like lactoylglutathione lyase family enzyme
MKTHLNLATANLDRSVGFYSTLLDAKPTKVLADYALFITDQPGLELALDQRSAVAPTTDAH